MKYSVVDLQGNKTGENIELNDSVWKAKYNSDLVVQALNVFRSNQRSGTANAKGKGDVSGGGRKPWRQKGTGRARHGSIRSPLWVGGGVTFTPNLRNWKRRINRKMKNNALKSVLSKRLADNEILFLDCANSERKQLNEKGRVLFVTSDRDLYLKFRNVVNFSIVSGKDLNTHNLTVNRKIYIDKADISNIESRLI